MLIAKGIHKYYGDLHVLRGVDLIIDPCSVVAIVGKSGAGKTTLLQILSTLDKPNSGSIFYEDKDVIQFKGNALAEFRNKEIGFVFQFHNLLPEFNAVENVAMPGLIAGNKLNDVLPRATDLLQRMDLANRLEHKPSQLSGGEQQRVAIARALINAPSLVFADEPSGNLDTKTSTEIHKLMLELRDEMGQSFIIVTHNLELASMCDRIITIEDGQIVDNEFSKSK